jgi:hypothetical protein
MKTKRFLQALTLATILAFSSHALAGLYTGNGIWEQDGGWSTTAYPNNGHFVTVSGNPVPDNNPTYNVSVNNPAPCTLSIGVAVQTVNIANGSTVSLANNGKINANTGLGNNGVIMLNSTGGGSQLRLANGSVVSATGQILMSDNATNYVSALIDGDTLTIAAGGVIRGAGQLNLGFFGGTEHLLNFVNHGLIEAAQPVNALAIGIQNDNNTNSNLTNDGTLRANNSSVLRLRTFGGSATVFNAGGIITAINNGRVRVGPNVTVTGGTLITAGNGVISGDGPGGSGGVLKDITNTGSVVIGDQEAITLAGTFTNNGSVTVNSAGNGATLRFVDGTTLAGTGTVTLSNNGSNYLMASNGSEALTIAPGATIQGAGNISPGFSGGSNMLRITNQGLVHANISGAALVIRAEAFNNTPFTNTGTLRASNGATLFFSGSSTLTNNGGTLDVLTGSTISAGGGITLLQTSGTIDLNGGDMNFPLGVDLNGGQLIGNGTFTGSVRNNGGTLGPGHSPGKIVITGNYTQGASGVLNMEIGGKTPGTQYDQLQVSGTATLGGTLNVSLINGFRPAVGDVFQLIAPSSFSGAFATVNTTGFTGQVNYSAGSTTITVLTVPDIPLNIATRVRVNPDPNQLIGGFIITGTEPKKVIIRAIGPSLSSLFPGVLADPTMELFQGTSLLASNDNWKIRSDGSSQQAEIEASTIPPTNDLESALVRTLAPGAYTAIVRGKGGVSGIGLVEVYDLDQTAKSKLANIATRGFVDTDNNVMIGGFIIGGNGQASARVVIRAIGPSLAAFGITSALQDPILELKNANGSTLISNDDWKQSQEAEINQTGLAPTDIRESALVTSLPDGNYTALVRGKNNSTGVALVEVYSIS